LSTRCRAAKFIFVSTDDDISVEEKLDTDKEDKQFSDPIRMEKTKELDQVRERERKGEAAKVANFTSLHAIPTATSKGGRTRPAKDLQETQGETKTGSIQDGDINGA
jgi:hypothetical protein